MSSDSTASPLQGPVPARLGKYELREEIGRGSMGIVYRGHDPYVGRDVALKLSLAESLADGALGERYRRMFFNEAHTAGRLRHPNILDIFDAGIEDQCCYIVMELVEGGRTLKDYTRAHRLLPVQRVVEIAFKCARALDYAHRQGVVHRDIKPSNILVTPDKDVKLADFSIAYITQPDTSRTMPTGFIGSPRYMSPEQIQEESVGPSSDLFSLGVVLYELLTGHHPFAADTFSRLVYRVVNDDPEPLTTYRADVPELLADIVRRALEKDPARRHASGLELASELSAAFAHLERPREDVSARERFESARALEFFAGFPDSELWEVVRASHWEHYAAGAEVVSEGDVEDCFFVVVDGELEVTKGALSLGRLGPGECFGEMAYFSKARRSATIRACSDVLLMKVNSTLIERLSTDCQLRFCKVFLGVLISRLARTTELLAQAG